MNNYNLAESGKFLFLLYSALFNPFTFALQQICPGVESVVVLITDLRILRTDHLFGLYSIQFGYRFIFILISNGLYPEILYLNNFINTEFSNKMQYIKNAIQQKMIYFFETQKNIFKDFCNVSCKVIRGSNCVGVFFVPLIAFKWSLFYMIMLFINLVQYSEIQREIQLQLTTFCIHKLWFSM